MEDAKMEEISVEFEHPTEPRSVFYSAHAKSEIPTIGIDCYTPTQMSVDVNNILNVDMKMIENGISHATYRYYIMYSIPPSLVVRRGRSFDINVNLQRALCTDLDSFTMKICWKFPADTGIFPGGECPVGEPYTVPIQMMPQYAYVSGPKEWQVICSGISTCGKVLCLKVLPPVEAMVGFYKLTIGHDWKEQTVQEYDLPTQIVVLFNAWNPRDVAYVAEPLERQHHLIDAEARVYAGTHNVINGYIWKYSQYSHQVLMAVLYLGASMAGIQPAEWSDLICIARKMLQVVEAPNGVIQGKWDGDYKDGQNPSDWTGSAEIFNQWLKTRKAVKYGQSFVFACLITTIFRTLGIASRNVTAFDSGIDADPSCAVDVYFCDDDSLRQEWNVDRKSESTWSNHVWCEIWIRRNDAGPDYQQSQWNSIYSFVGPAFVSAIRKGKIRVPHETNCFYSYVNADIFNWKIDRFQPTKLISLDSKFVGKCVYTFGANKLQLNITDKYKHKELTQKEREIDSFVLRQTNPKFQDYKQNRPLDDFHFAFKEIKYVHYGQGCSLIVTMTNKNNSTVVIDAGIKVYRCNYTNNTDDVLKKTNATLTVQHNGTETLELSVDPEDYAGQYSHFSYLKCFAYGTMNEPHECDYLLYQTFQILPPKVGIEVSPSNPKPNEVSKISSSFINTSTMDLDGYMQFTELDTGNVVNLGIRTVRPGAKYRALFHVKPTKIGKYEGRISFISPAFRTSVVVQLNVRE